MGHIGYPGPVHLHVRRQVRISIVGKIVQLPFHNFSCLFTRFILFVQVYSFSTINSVSVTHKRLPFASREGIQQSGNKWHAYYHILPLISFYSCLQ